MRSAASQAALATREEAAAALAAACEAFPSTQAGAAMQRAFPLLHDHKFDRLLHALGDGK